MRLSNPMYPPTSLNIIYPVIHLPTISSSPFTFTFQSIIHLSIDFFTPLLFHLFIHPVTQFSPIHSSLSFPTIFPFIYPLSFHLLASPLCSLRAGIYWELWGPLSDVGCVLSEMLRFGRKDIHLWREKCSCLAMWSGPCRWDTGYGSGGILRKVDGGTGGCHSCL